MTEAPSRAADFDPGAGEPEHPDPTTGPSVAPERLGEPLVVLSDVQKHFGSLHVLKDINLSVRKGEVVVVLGPSGSGKSTLCRVINRLETIESGTITIDGQALPEEGKALAKLRADVGMVFQSFNLFSHKTVLENVTLGPTKARRKPAAEARQRAMDLLRWAWSRRPRSTPRSCPAGSSSGWRSPARWPWSRRSSCSTSPPRRWTRRWSTRCWT
jgi:glutamate transport system ATP-binding protein